MLMFVLVGGCIVWVGWWIGLVVDGLVGGIIHLEFAFGGWFVYICLNHLSIYLSQ